MERIVEDTLRGMGSRARRGPGDGHNLAGVAVEELANVQVRLLVTRLITLPLPTYAANRLRTAVWRCMGWRIGRGSVLFGNPALSGYGAIHERLHIGNQVWINERCRIELSETVSIGDNCAIGHDVLIITSTHRIGRRDRRAGALVVAPVVIGEGAWIGARSVVLPGVTIGHGAVVGAGAVVTKDVPPNSVVVGVPARLLRTLTDADDG
jgi:acetyltransferase-like isoleucine patch superfamily enzyme